MAVGRTRPVHDVRFDARAEVRGTLATAPLMAAWQSRRERRACRVCRTRALF